MMRSLVVKLSGWMMTGVQNRNSIDVRYGTLAGTLNSPCEMIDHCPQADGFQLGGGGEEEKALVLDMHFT